MTSRRENGTTDSIAYRASMSGAHSCLRKNAGRYASMLPRARSRHWHFPVKHRDTAPNTPARRVRESRTERREASRETNGSKDARKRTNERASQRTEVESTTLNIGCKIVRPMTSASARCAHDRAVHSVPFIAFALKLGALRSKRVVSWYSMRHDHTFV